VSASRDSGVQLAFEFQFLAAQLWSALRFACRFKRTLGLRLQLLRPAV